MARKIDNRYEFDTQIEAEEFAENFRDTWRHGYDGTATVTPPKTDGGKWIVNTSRYDSCD